MAPWGLAIPTRGADKLGAVASARRPRPALFYKSSDPTAPTVPQSAIDKTGDRLFQGYKQSPLIQPGTQGAVEPLTSASNKVPSCRRNGIRRQNVAGVFEGRPVLKMSTSRCAHSSIGQACCNGDQFNCGLMTVRHDRPAGHAEALAHSKSRRSVPFFCVQPAKKCLWFSRTSRDPTIPLTEYHSINHRHYRAQQEVETPPRGTRTCQDRTRSTSLVQR